MYTLYQHFLGSMHHTGKQMLEGSFILFSFLCGEYKLYQLTLNGCCDRLFDYIVLTVIFHWKSRKTVVVTFMCTFSFFCIWALIILVWEGNSNFMSWSRYGLDRWESVPSEKWQGCMPEVLKTNSFQVPESHFVGVCPIHVHPLELPKSVDFK